MVMVAQHYEYINTMELYTLKYIQNGKYYVYFFILHGEKKASNVLEFIMSMMLVPVFISCFSSNLFPVTHR